jgi:hypothetical protein
MVGRRGASATAPVSDRQGTGAAAAARPARRRTFRLDRKGPGAGRVQRTPVRTYRRCRQRPRAPEARYAGRPRPHVRAAPAVEGTCDSMTTQPPETASRSASCSACSRARRACRGGIFAGETLGDDFAARNPLRETPVLELDSGEHRAQSAAILWYLAEGSEYLPRSPLDRTRVVQWLTFEQERVMSTIGGARFRILTGRLAPGDLAVLARLAGGREALGVLDEHLAATPVRGRRPAVDRRPRALQVRVPRRGRRPRPGRVAGRRCVAGSSASAAALRRRSPPLP